MSQITEAGIVALNVSIKLDSEQLKVMPIETIRTLFEGLAKTIAACGQNVSATIMSDQRSEKDRK